MNKIVIGVGSEFRGDDALGIRIVEILKNENLSKNIIFSIQSGEGTRLMSSWSNEDEVIIVDCVNGDNNQETVGKIVTFNACEKVLESEKFRCSTHAFGVREAIEMNRTLGTLPKKLMLYGIYGKNFKMGSSMSHEVESSMKELIEKIKIELGE